MTDIQTEQELADRVIWAVGGKGSTDNLAHAYINDTALESNNCLCGRGVKPHIVIDVGKWDLSDTYTSEHTCPQCRARLQLLRYCKR